MAGSVLVGPSAGLAAAQLPRACVKFQPTSASSCIRTDPQSATNTTAKSQAASGVYEDIISKMKAGKRAAVQDQLLAEIRAIKSAPDVERSVSC